jgi:hypothetical protein
LNPWVTSCAAITGKISIHRGLDSVIQLTLFQSGTPNCFIPPLFETVTFSCDNVTASITAAGRKASSSAKMARLEATRDERLAGPEELAMITVDIEG